VQADPGPLGLVHIRFINTAVCSVFLSLINPVRPGFISIFEYRFTPDLFDTGKDRACATTMWWGLVPLLRVG